MFTHNLVKIGAQQHELASEHHSATHRDLAQQTGRPASSPRIFFTSR